MHRECRERFPRHRLQRKPVVSDPASRHVPWCMSGSLTRGGGENVPGIPGACATRTFTYLARGPCHDAFMSSGRHYRDWSPSQAIWRGSGEIRLPLGAPDNILPPAKLSQFTYLQDTNDTVISKCPGWSYGSSIFCILKWGPYLSYGEVIWHIEGWTTWPNYCRRHLKKIFFVNKNICNSRIMFPTVELTTSQHCMVLISDFWPLLLTWFNFNPSMDK